MKLNVLFKVLVLMAFLPLAAQADGSVADVCAASATPQVKLFGPVNVVAFNKGDTDIWHVSTAPNVNIEITLNGKTVCAGKSNEEGTADCQITFEQDSIGVAILAQVTDPNGCTKKSDTFNYFVR